MTLEEFKAQIPELLKDDGSYSEGDDPMQPKYYFNRGHLHIEFHYSDNPFERIEAGTWVICVGHTTGVGKTIQEAFKDFLGF